MFTDSLGNKKIAYIKNDDLAQVEQATWIKHGDELAQVEQATWIKHGDAIALYNAETNPVEIALSKDCIIAESIEEARVILSKKYPAQSFLHTNIKTSPNGFIIVKVGWLDSNACIHHMQNPQEKLLPEIKILHEIPIDSWVIEIFFYQFSNEQKDKLNLCGIFVDRKMVLFVYDKKKALAQLNRRNATLKHAGKPQKLKKTKYNLFDLYKLENELRSMIRKTFPCEEFEIKDNFQRYKEPFLRIIDGIHLTSFTLTSTTFKQSAKVLYLLNSFETFYGQRSYRKLKEFQRFKKAWKNKTNTLRRNGCFESFIEFMDDEIAVPAPKSSRLYVQKSNFFLRHIAKHLNKDGC